jgi:hypothetical protein
MEVQTHVWFRNLSFVSENITSQLTETHTVALKQHCCFSVEYTSTIAYKLFGQEV